MMLVKFVSQLNIIVLLQLLQRVVVVLLLMLLLQLVVLGLILRLVNHLAFNVRVEALHSFTGLVSSRLALEVAQAFLVAFQEAVVVNSTFIIEHKDQMEVEEIIRTN